MNIQRRLQLFSSFRSADDEAAEAYLGGCMISASAESQTESRKWPIKAGTIVTLGISLLLHWNSAFGRKRSIYMERVWWWWWVGGGGGLLRCGTTWRPPPEPPHPKQVKHVEKASGKKQHRQRWCTKIKKASLCDSPLNTDAEWRECSSRCFAVWGLQILSTWLKTWRFTLVVWRKLAWTGKTLRLTHSEICIKGVFQ